MKKITLALAFSGIIAIGFTAYNLLYFLLGVMLLIAALITTK